MTMTMTMTMTKTADRWPINDEQVMEKTGRPLAHWRGVLDAFSARSKPPRSIVGHLQARHQLTRQWSHHLMMWYLGDAARR